MLKTDDDVFINMYELFNYITLHEHDTPAVHGSLKHNAEIARNREAYKYFAPREVLPNEIHPDFVRGGCYLIPKDVVTILSTAVLNVTYINSEDGLVTGYACEVSNITRVHAPNF